jgi:hypothetical protein
MLGRLLSLIQCWPNSDIQFATSVIFLAYSKCTKKFQWTEDTLVVVQLVKKFIARLEPTSQRFIPTYFIFHTIYKLLHVSARPTSGFYPKFMQPELFHALSLSPVLIILFHVHRHVANGLLAAVCTTKNVCAFILSPMLATFPSKLSSFWCHNCRNIVEGHNLYNGNPSTDLSTAGAWGSQKLVHEGGKIVSSMYQTPWTLISLRGRVGSRAIVRP